MPEAAVTPGGWVTVRSGSMTAIVGRSRAWLMPVFTLSASTSITQIVVLSEPVPVVVGTATFYALRLMRRRWRDVPSDAEDSGTEDEVPYGPPRAREAAAGDGAR